VLRSGPQQQAAVQHGYLDAVTVARFGGDARVGSRAGRDFLRFGRGAGGGGRDVEDVIRGDHPFAEEQVSAGAGIFHGDLLGELETGQPADILAVLDGRGVQEIGHLKGLGVTDQNGPGPVEVVNVASRRPIGRVSFRSFETRLDTGHAVKDQIELYIETGRRLAAVPFAFWHASSFRI
jgi:hypothetical protein